MDSYRIEWKVSASKELSRLDRSTIPRIHEAVSHLAVNLFPNGSCGLKGGEPTFRIRVGDYGIIYEIVQDRLVVEIIRVRHRKDAYG